MFDFVMKCSELRRRFWYGRPKQLKQLPEHAFLFNTKVVDIQAIITTTGEQIQSDIVIVATEATALISKYKTTTETKHHSVTNVYFEAK
jgi:hypothetical protein